MLLPLAMALRAQVPTTITTNIFDQLLATQPPIQVPSEVTATAEFDPPVVRPGEKSVYRVRFNAAEASVHLPETIPAPEPLKLRKTASGQIAQPGPTGLMTVTTFDFDAHPAEPGDFTVPEMTVEVYGKPVVIPAARLQVRADANHDPVRQLVIELSESNVFIGQSVPVRVMLLATPSHPPEGVARIELTGDGFVTERTGARAMIHPVERDGRSVPAFLYETTIAPIVAGRVRISAQGYTAGLQAGAPLVISGQVVLSGGPPSYVLLDSEPVTMNVRPLPENEAPGFTGAVGQFALASPTLSTNAVRVGDPIELTVTIRGDGDLKRIKSPRAPHAKGWQMFPANRVPTPQSLAAGGPGASFAYTLIPTSGDVRETPAIPFSSFDPASGKYVNLTVPPQPITILPGASREVSEPRGGMVGGTADGEPKLELSALADNPGVGSSLVPLQMRAWFPLVQLSPIVFFGGIWMWDRRRRYLEQHPEIVRRRKARRMLRREVRELRRAEASGDAKRFVISAVNAMRVASAPHFPAHPRALVCRDVLEVLNGSGRGGNAEDVVRKFFAAADASSFSNARIPEAELFREREGLASVLQTLEAKL